MNPCPTWPEMMRTAPPSVFCRTTCSAAQHFHTLDVEQIHDASTVGQVHVVDVDRHAGLERQRAVAQADAADERCRRRALNPAERRSRRSVKESRSSVLVDAPSMSSAGRRERRLLQIFAEARR
jgi:hypothetical protein